MERGPFEALYRDVSRKLAAYLARTCGDLALAEDLTQEAFVRMLTSAPPNIDGEEARRYVYRVASNLLRDHLRRRAREPELDMPAEADSDWHAIDTRLDVGPVLAKLSPRDRQLLWLAYVEEYTHREIASIAGLSALSIRPLLFRARSRFLREMKRLGFDVASTTKELNQ